MSGKQIQDPIPQFGERSGATQTTGRREARPATSFADLARPLIAKGIACIPVVPFGKDPELSVGAAKSSTDPAQIARWNALNPNFNVGCVGRPEGVVILDLDSPDLLARIEAEIGPISDTFTVRSAGKGLPHLYYRQTDVSRALGNRSRAGLFDLRSKNTYVVGPNSKLKTATGEIKTYEIVKDVEIGLPGGPR